ncbi:MAG: hypothetical protein ACOVRB_08450 [Akkermansiaceae bacterium]|jgi:hypothetical protein
MDANSKSFPSAGSPLKKFKLLGVAVSCLFWVTNISIAQEENVSMKIDLVAWGDAIGGLSLKEAETNGSLVAMPFQYSKAVNYSGPRTMEIHKSGNGGIAPKAEASEEDKKHELMPLVIEEKKDDLASQGKKSGLQVELENRRKESPTLVALVPLPANCRRATVLLAPADAGTYLAYVVDDDPSKLPMGQLRIHNLSSFPIALRCNGTEPKELKIRDTMLVAAPDQQCIYEIACKDSADWRIIENNVIPVRPNEQTQMIILKSKNQYFLSADGSSGGFLQTVILRRRPEAVAPATP